MPAKTQKQPYKLDLFQVLERIDLKDRDFFRNLPEEQQQAFAPVLILKWMSCGNDGKQLINLNDVPNRYVFNLHKEKDLLYFLFTTCTTGRKQFRRWDKVSKKDKGMSTIAVDVIKQYFNYNTQKAKECLCLFTNDEIVQYARALGYEIEQIKKLETSLK